MVAMGVVLDTYPQTPVQGFRVVGVGGLLAQLDQTYQPQGMGHHLVVSNNNNVDLEWGLVWAQAPPLPPAPRLPPMVLVEWRL